MQGGAGPAIRLFLLAASLASAASDAKPTRRPVTHVPLEALVPADLDRARMRGTGCTWSDRNGGRMRLVASDDRAMVKLGGRLLMLRPAPDAAEMFPFTHDRWIGEGVAIAITAHGAPLGGGGASVRAALLDVKVAGRASKARGLLDCGT